MEGNVFYELHSQLYASAVAGSGLITENFRLKKAVERFEPISKTNAAFTRLYQMCQNLFLSENTAQELADCIALADALAVAQGSFLDRSVCEGKKREITLKPQHMVHSEIQFLKEELLKGKTECRNYLEENLEKVLEPRIFPAFLQGLCKGSWWLHEVAETLFPKLGDDVLDLLKEQIDFETTGAKNKTDYYIKLIAELYGEAETDWYIEIAENETYPKNIRQAAIWALGQSEKNTGKLLELYKTQKGVIKNAVIYELARLEPPEAVEIWKKLIDNYKESYEDFITCSKSDICADFVRDVFYETVEDCEQNYRKGKNLEDKEVRENNYYLNWIIKNVRRKYQLEDCFHLFAEKYEYIEKTTLGRYRDWREEINQALIENLLEEDSRYSKMIKNLYKEHKDFYFPARFFLALKETGEQTFEEYRNEMRKQREQVLKMLEYIEYDSILKGYFISWRCLAGLYGIGKERHHRLKVFDTFPDSLLSFVSETSYLPDKTEERQEKQKRDTSNDWNPEDTIKQAFQIIDPQGLRLDEGTTDYEKCKAATVKFAFDINRRYSIGYEIEEIEELYKGASEEYIGLITNYVLQNIFSENQYDVSVIRKIEELPLKEEDMKKELLELKKKIEAFQITSSENWFQKKCKREKMETLSEIKQMIKEHGWED